MACCRWVYSNDSQRGSSQWVAVRGPASCLNPPARSAQPFWSSRSLPLHQQAQFGKGSSFKLCFASSFFFQFFQLSLKSQRDSPSSRGCRTASERRLTTVSRPFTSADTAYMVVSLQYKTKMPTFVSILRKEEGPVLEWKVDVHKIRPRCLWLQTSMFDSHRFLHVSPTWEEFHLYCHTEQWTADRKHLREQ